eukprot:4554476-Alexandrium_andersonii.AAC.1
MEWVLEAGNGLFAPTYASAKHVFKHMVLVAQQGLPSHVSQETDCADTAPITQHSSPIIITSHSPHRIAHASAKQ